ncbi:MAG: VOC family protein [Chloroflexota bacterium]|nr:VOC family protein [Caldilinea sp.]GIK72515.1 MAG: VOC family protein [Chloroflexota bacterium]
MATSSKIIPHLWFDKEALEAAQFYVSIFPNSRLGYENTLHDTPSGDTAIVAFELVGQAFSAISAGPLFKPNPSISFTIGCASADEVNALWEQLADGGKALMPLDAYPFSERYGWIQDRYGVSWQIAVSGEASVGAPTLTPSLLFVGENCGRAEEAIHFYTSVFRDSSVGAVLRYGSDQTPGHEGLIMYADFLLERQRFIIGESSFEHDFAFNEAISFMVNCDTQEEIDYYWERLSAVPEAEQCGWLKDKYGLSWQIVPTAMGEMMRSGSPEQIARITQAFLPMKKLDLATLQSVYAGSDRQVTIPAGHPA